ncbi:MAG: hypothetical protein ACI9TV_002093 [Sulfurimonas sp.]|jgi:hypothetical protein|uniref:hypothetical protein n=1 Tax=Sulfurimonas sp. TaxID=2022749 RepID=UPI0039E6B065
MLNNYTTTRTTMLHSPECDTFTYKDMKVKIITVFSDQKIPIALVENENGEMFEVPRDSLT